MKMSFLKRSMLFVFCLIFAFTMVMAGCSKSSDSGTSSNTSTAATEDKKDKDNSGISISEPGVFPIVKDKINLKFLTQQMVYIEDINTNEFTKYMEDKTNVHITWETIPSANVTEKVNLVLASGNYPDVFYHVGIKKEHEAQYGSQEKVFLPIENYIDKYAVELKKIFNEVAGSRQRITNLDGHIYTMPNINECYHCMYAAKMWINKPWLDKLGLGIPTTTDEFYQVLKAFKEKDPNGNGKPDEIPLAGAHKSGWFSTVDLFLMNSFLYYTLDLTNDRSIDDKSLGLYLNNGKVDIPFNSSEVKEGLKFLNKLYKEGLLYEGTFTQDSSQLTQLVENPDAELVGVVPGGYGGIFSKVAGERYRQYVGLTPLKGANGVQNAYTYHYQGVETGSFVVSKNCKYPEVAVKWCDHLYSFDGTMRLTRGRPDKEWRAPKEGEKGIDGKPALYVPLVPWQDTEPQNACFVQLGPNKRTAAIRMGEFMDSNVDIYSGPGLEKLLYEVTKNQYEPYAQKDKVLPPVKLYKEENDELMTLTIELVKHMRESTTKFMIGELSLDKDWDNFMKNLDKLQISKVLEIYQKAYDREYKK